LIKRKVIPKKANAPKKIIYVVKNVIKGLMPNEGLKKAPIVAIIVIRAKEPKKKIVGLILVKKMPFFFGFDES